MRIRPVLWLAASFALATACASGIALGGEVTLSSHSGGLTLTGDLISSEGGSYVIKSGFGVVAPPGIQLRLPWPGVPQSSFGHSQHPRLEYHRRAADA